LTPHDSALVEAEEPAVAELAEVIDQHVEDTVGGVGRAEGIAVFGEGQ
jgi:hypothetical protein